MLALALAAVAAPAPYLEKLALEVVLATGSPQRTQALLRWVKAPDLAAAIQPGWEALPPAFLSKLAVVDMGGRAILRLAPSATAEERALLGQLVAVVSGRSSAEDLSGEALAAAAGRLTDWRITMPINRARATPQGRQQLYDEALADIDIRQNPPRLLPRPAR